MKRFLIVSFSRCLKDIIKYIQKISEHCYLIRSLKIELVPNFRQMFRSNYKEIIR